MLHRCRASLAAVTIFDATLPTIITAIDADAAATLFYYFFRRF